MAGRSDERSDALILAEKITRENPDLPPPGPPVYVHRGPHLFIPTWTDLKFLFTGKREKRE